MRLHVSPKVGAVGKRLVADGARIRFLSRVRPQMALKQPRSREGLSAHVALVVKIVCKNVHGERRHRDVHLAANVTLFGVVAVQASVCLLVSREIRAGGVVFAALIADVFGFGLRDPVLAFLRPAIGDRQSRTRGRINGVGRGGGQVDGRIRRRVCRRRQRILVQTARTRGTRGDQMRINVSVAVVIVSAAAVLPRDVDEGRVLLMVFRRRRRWRMSRPHCSQRSGEWGQRPRQLKEVVSRVLLLLGVDSRQGRPRRWRRRRQRRTYEKRKRKASFMVVCLMFVRK